MGNNKVLPAMGTPSHDVSQVIRLFFKTAQRVGVFVALSTGAIAAQEQVYDPVQRQFYAAGVALAAGDLAQAQRLLDALVATAPTPRILLEAARVAYLQGNYERAQTLFERAKKAGNVPLKVRDAIDMFERMIANRTAHWDYQLGIVAEQNPDQRSDAQEVIIDGLTYRLDQTADNRVVWGVRHTLDAAGEPMSLAVGDVRLSTHIEFDDLAHKTHDRLRSSVQATLTPKNYQTRFAAGVHSTRRDGWTRLVLPYASAERVMSGWRGLPLLAQMSISMSDVKKYDYADATTTQMSATQFLRRNQEMAVQFTLDRSWAREPFWSHSGGSIGVSHQLYVMQDRLKITGRARWRRVVFDQADSLFGRRRSDDRQSYQISLTHQNWRLYGKHLSLGYRYEQTRSTLSTQSYDAYAVFITLE